MAERIQNILARQKAAQVEAGNLRGARILKRLQLEVARAVVRGAFVKDGTDPLVPQAETQCLVEGLKRGGYFVYRLTGKSPSDLRAEGMNFWHVNPALERVSVAPSLVGFRQNPDSFFLRGSQNIPHARMLELLEEEKARVERAYPSAGLIVREGKASEWVELAREHFEETHRKARLFGGEYGYSYTWTDTYRGDQVGAGRAFVGFWYEALGLFVDFDLPDYVSPHLRLAPLVEIPWK